jgi:hypothetical protein
MPQGEKVVYSTSERKKYRGRGKRALLILLGEHTVWPRGLKIANAPGNLANVIVSGWF